MIAILPAAGLGTRMAEITGGRPKEMLPLKGIPVLQHVLDECYAGGCRECRVIGSPHKPEIPAYLAECLHSPYSYSEQLEARGLADAVRYGAIPAENALIPMPDTVYAQKAPTAVLAKLLQDGAWAAVAVHEVPGEQVERYGIVDFGEDGVVHSVIEKPTQSEAPSRYAIAGRFAFCQEAMEWLVEEAQLPNLTELIALGLSKARPVRAVIVEAEPFDCGSPEGYFAAVEELSS